MENGFYAFGGVLSLIMGVFLLIAGIMAIFIPFWVYRIRCETIEMNEKMDRLIKIAMHRVKSENQQEPEVPNFINPEYIKCSRCGQDNDKGEIECIKCGEILLK